VNLGGRLPCPQGLARGAVDPVGVAAVGGEGERAVGAGERLADRVGGRQRAGHRDGTDAEHVAGVDVGVVGEHAAGGDLQGVVLADRAGVDAGRRCVVAATDADGDGARHGATLAIVEREGELLDPRFAGRQILDGGGVDGVGPHDRTAIHAGGERAQGTVGGDDIGQHAVAIGGVDVGEGDAASVTEAARRRGGGFGDGASQAAVGDDGRVVGAGEGHADAAARDATVAIVEGQREGFHRVSPAARYSMAEAATW
jgi:hypothetical protein